MNSKPSLRSLSILGIVVVILSGLAISWNLSIAQVVNYPSPAIHSRQNGAWNTPQTWEGNIVPARSSDVVVEHDVQVTSTAEARHVDILPATFWRAGRLTLQGGELHVYEGSVVVWGTLTGNTGKMLFHVGNDRLFASNAAPNPDTQNPDFYRNDYGLWAMPHSAVTLEGPPVTSWLNALPVSAVETPLLYGAVTLPSIGNGVALLASAPTGWQAGDKLVLASVEGTYAIATLTGVNGTAITYNDPSNFVAMTLKAEGRSVHPKIGNLSRRLVIASADVREGDANHRAHTNYFHHSTVRLKNVEFLNLGPRQKLGRYPIHFHHARIADGNEVSGSSIWQDVSDVGSRFVAIHNTQGLIVRDNVAVRSQGHGFFMEDGREINNVLTGNLSVDTRSPEELPVTNPNRVNGSHHFWTRAGNTVDDNVAVGPERLQVAARLP